MRYTDERSGITISGGHPFAQLLANTIEDFNKRQREWCRKIAADGVMACHPDDGWVNRERNSVHFCYPDFNLRPQVGDRIALGDVDRHRFVRVTEVKPRIFKLPGVDNNDYYFEACEA